jgi:Domain of unknown function (DUF4159)
MTFRVGSLAWALVLVFSAWGLAQEPNPCFAVARLQYGGGGDWYAGPSMLPNLHARLKRDLLLEVCKEEKVVRLSDPDLYRYPILFMTGHGQVVFSQEERRILRQYLLGGGLLFADDNYGLAPSFRQEMTALFPHLPLTPLPKTHPIFSAHHAFAKGLPKIHQHDGKPATAYGIALENRLLVLFTSESDLGNGWEDQGTYPNPPHLHEEALRMGVNVVAHFLQGGLQP